MISTESYIGFAKSEVEQSIASRFEKQVARYGDRLAVTTQLHRLSYNDLNGLANRLARSIPRGGAAVAILLDHDAPLIAAILAVLKAGRFYVVLEPSHPAERLRVILEDSQADLIITDTPRLTQAQKIGGPNSQFLNVDRLQPDLSEENLGLETSPSALAYLIYTSGSTGKPKGVCQTQRNVLHNTRKYTNTCHLCADDRFSLLALCSFSASVSNLFGALLNGAALLPFKVKEEGVASLADWMRREQVSIYHSVPLVFRTLANALDSQAKFPTLRLIKLGGEPITRGDFDLYKKHFSKHARLYIGLGASEMNCTRCWLLDEESDFNGPVAPVGYAVEETDVLLLDENQREVPEGEIGEIAIRSPYLFPGYWRRPELTDSVLVPDPAGTAGRVFRTGDLGRMLPGGLLMHLGRNEFQIKIRGSRIEPAEIEFVLRSQPEITECVVLARERADEQELVAYLTNGKGEKPGSSALRARLADKLPEYMVPARFIWLDQLPLANGKVDRKALQGLQSDREYVAPRSELEAKLVGIWRTVFNHDDLGIRDDFRELGGHSLMAARIAVQLDRELDVKLPVSALFRYPTIELLAEHLREKDFAAPTPSLVPLQVAGSNQPLFIMHGWGGDVYFFHELAKLLPGQPSYGLQAQGLDGKRRRHISIEEMAAHYIGEIRAFQPEGPYHLAGYSLGALIAFEMALQLHALGQDVAFLGLLDPPIRPAPLIPYTRTLTPHLWRSGSHYIGRWLRTRGRESVHLKRRWRRLQRWIAKNQPKSVVLSAPLKESVTPPAIPGFRDYYSAVAAPYRLRRYPGRIDLIVSDTLVSTLLPLWGHLAKRGAKLHRVSCTHRQMIEPQHLPVVATALAAALQSSR